MKQKISFLKKKSILVDWAEKPNKNLQMTAAFNVELMNLGFCLSNSAYAALLGFGADADTYVKYLEIVRTSLGADKNYAPMYKGFPKEVMDKSLLDLYINAIFHYWTEGEWMPQSPEIQREFVFPIKKFQEISILGPEKFNAIFTELCSSKTSLTPFDKESLEWFCSNIDVDKYFPAEIPFKETLCILASKGYNVPVKTATDVLRIAAYLSGVDISLPAIHKPVSNFLRNKIYDKSQYFKKFSRKERKYLLSLLDSVKTPQEDMVRYTSRWIRLGEILHPGEYKLEYHNAYNAFTQLRDDAKSIRTFNSDVQRAIDTRNAAEVFSLLSLRPGEFARKLNQLLEKFPVEDVFENFKMVVGKLPSKVLIELISYTKERSKEQEFRTVVIKGVKTKMKILPGQPALDLKIIKPLLDILLDEVAVRSKDRNEAEVFIHPQLYRTPYPFAMRSSAESVNTISRGTRIQIPEGVNFVRSYVHWQDDDGSIDLDLSALFISSDFHQIDQVSFTNLKSTRLNSCHSGDIRHRRGSNAEYIDIDIEACISSSVQYVMFQVHDFNGRGFDNHTHPITFGWLPVSKPIVQEIFTPKNVENAVRMVDQSSTCYAAIFDVASREMIWTDIRQFNILKMQYSRVESNITSAMATFKGIVDLVQRKLTIGEFLEIVHVKGNNMKLISAPTDISLNYDKFVDYTDITTKI